MKKAFAYVILGVVLVCVVAAMCFWISSRNKQDLPYLNYKNLAPIAAQSDTLPASRSEIDGSYVIDGARLAQFLDEANWTAQIGFIQNVQQDTEQNFKFSIQIKLDNIYLIVFDTDTARIYDETAGKDIFYRMSNGDYEELLAMLNPDF